MPARIRLAVVLSIVLGAPATLQASPITYDFAGTLNQLLNGTTQFSGSFTIDSNPNDNGGFATPGGAGIVIGENGDEVSLTVHIGGQTIGYINTAQNPDNVDFSAIGGGSILENPPLPAIVGISLAAGTPGTNNQIEFYLNFSHPGSAPQLADLVSLASSSYAASVSLTDNSGGQMPEFQGSITSIEQVPAPEPSMLAVFGVMALAGMAHRLSRKFERTERGS
jgi:hypothetical protein